MVNLFYDNMKHVGSVRQVVKMTVLWLDLVWMVEPLLVSKKPWF